MNTWANKQTRNSRRRNGRVERLASDAPSICDIPDVLPPLANAKPPPSKNIKLHGMFELMYFHVIKLGVVALGSLSGLAPEQKFNQLKLAGNMNNAITMKMAGVASPILNFVLSTNSSAQPGKNPMIRQKINKFRCPVLGVSLGRPTNYLVHARRTMQRKARTKRQPKTETRHQMVSILQTKSVEHFRGYKWLEFPHTCISCFDMGPSSLYRFKIT